MKIQRILLTVILCSPFIGPAQSLPVSQRFTNYARQAFTEKLYVHTDRDNYLAGQIIWWKLYYVDGYLHKPTDLSKVVYVEVLDNNNKPLLQAKALLDTTGSNGSFYLPLSVPTGNYTLRAYTNWMKNFHADYFFTRQISIINPLKPGALPPAASTIPLYDAGFFPEGGNLVRNIESRVGFRVTDQYGRGQAFKGVVLDENKDTILRFMPLRNGIGNFVFTPSGSHRYQAIIRLPDDQTILRDLPVIAEQGYVMSLKSDGDGPIDIAVASNMPDASEVTLFAHTRQIAKITQKLVIQNGKAVFHIDRKLLGEGISQFTLFDQKALPVCERLFFIYPKSVLGVEAGANNKEYGLRKKVNLALQTKVGDRGGPSSLSVSVYRVDSLEKSSQQNIQSALWLSSDLKGSIESPASYFIKNDPEVITAMDNLMLTHGWRRFSWQGISQNDFRIAYQPEFDGHIITGSIKDANSGKPVPRADVFLSIPGMLTQFYPAISDSSGRIHFDARDYYGAGDILLQPDSTIIANYKIEVDNPFVSNRNHGALPPLSLAQSVAPNLARSSFGMQVQNVYAADSLNNFAYPAVDSFPFYGRHGRVYKLDDYVRFTTIEEVLREYVLEVGVRQRGGQPHLMVMDMVNRGFLTQEPIILLDGVPVSHSSMFAFDPLKIRKLQVVAARYLIGEFIYDGIISFTTYRHELDELPLNARINRIEYDGLQLHREFFSPVYKTETEISARIPDYRELLFWAPDVQTGKTGTAQLAFYTSDVPGKYVVVIEGMDKSGNAGWNSFSFDVKP